MSVPPPRADAAGDAPGPDPPSPLDRGRLQLALLQLLLVSAVALHHAGPVWNPDLPWHLASGEHFWSRGELPQKDPFTFTAGDRRWIHHEWGGQLLLAAVHHLGGWSGLRALRAALAGVAFLLVVEILRRAGASRAAALAAATVLWPLFEANVTLRPHLLAWVLFLAVVGGVLLAPRPWGRARWGLLLLLTVLWVNLHSSALLLPAILAVEALARAAGGAPATAWRRARSWAGAAVATGLACLLQPAGWQLLPYALATPGVNAPSDEWRTLLAPDVAVRKPWLLVSLAFLAAACVFAAWQRRRDPGRASGGFPSTPTSLALLALALWSRRMTLFLVVPAIEAVHALAPRLAGAWSRPRPSLRRALGATLLATIGVFVLRGLTIAGGPAVAPGAYPIDAVRFLAASGVRGRAYAVPAWGGYLAWRLHPGVRVFIDGRWVLVGRRVVHDAIRFAQRREPVEADLERYGVEVFVEPTADHLRRPPLDPRRWVLAYRDGVAVVLLRRGGGSEANLAAARDFYARRPALGELARWPQDPCGSESPPPACATPSVLDPHRPWASPRRRVRRGEPAPGGAAGTDAPRRGAEPRAGGTSGGANGRGHG